MNASPATWHPDPTGRHQLRYWNGAAWTEHVVDDGVPAVDPLEAPVEEIVGTDTTEVDETVPDPGAEAAALDDEEAPGDASATELTSVDGKAHLTDTHLVFEYNAIARSLRRTKRSEIPLQDITGYEIVSGKPAYLRVTVRGWSVTPEPNRSATSFALHPRKPHDRFVAALIAATAAPEDAVTEGLRAQAREDKSAATQLRKQNNASNPTALFGGAVLRGAWVTQGLKRFDVGEATAEATIGAPSSRMTVTRLGGGALLLGPLGLVLGAVAKKNTSKCYVTIDTPGGVIVLEDSAKKYPAAVKFADAVNRSRRLS